MDEQKTQLIKLLAADIISNSMDLCSEVRCFIKDLEMAETQEEKLRVLHRAFWRLEREAVISSKHTKQVKEIIGVAK